jgi:hypothetical protein
VPIDLLTSSAHGVIVQKIVAELMKVWPDVAPARLGKHDVFRHREETPAHNYESVVKVVDGERLIELTARDRFDGELAAFVLDTMDGQELPVLGSGRIRVIAARFPQPWRLECIVVVPPPIAKRFDHQSARLRRITYWIIPAFAGEFRNGEDGDAFWHQIHRKDGWNVSPIRWDRVRKTEPVWD